MRKLVGWPVCWALYLIGNLLSLIMVGPLGRLYPVYNRVMLASVDINDWARLTIWSQADGEVNHGAK